MSDLRKSGCVPELGIRTLVLRWTLKQIRVPFARKGGKWLLGWQKQVADFGSFTSFHDGLPITMPCEQGNITSFVEYEGLHFRQKIKSRQPLSSSWYNTYSS